MNSVNSNKSNKSNRSNKSKKSKKSKKNCTVTTLIKKSIKKITDRKLNYTSNDEYDDEEMKYNQKVLKELDIDKIMFRKMQIKTPKNRTNIKIKPKKELQP